VKVGDVVRFESGARQHEAKITFVAAAADPGSRTVQVTAEVGSPGDAALRPGAFARVTIGVGGNAEAVLIPEVAIRPSEDGFIVFVVEGDKARRRIVELGLRTADGMVEVRSGVKAGELVVVRGAEALREGVTVNMGGGAGGKPADTPGAPAAPAGGAARPPEKAAP
jgi:RND family efflux transporter MFP subunit